MILWHSLIPMLLRFVCPNTPGNRSTKVGVAPFCWTSCTGIFEWGVPHVQTGFHVPYTPDWHMLHPLTSQSTTTPGPFEGSPYGSRRCPSSPFSVLRTSGATRSTRTDRENERNGRSPNVVFNRSKSHRGTMGFQLTGEDGKMGMDQYRDLGW